MKKDNGRHFSDFLVKSIWGVLSIGNGDMLSLQM